MVEATTLVPTSHKLESEHTHSIELVINLLNWSAFWPTHGGHFENWTKIFHHPTSSGSKDWANEWTSERASAAERASEASSVEQENEWPVQTNKQMDELVARN